MKHSIFALPALLRPAALLALASANTFNVQDDLLAYPQFEVKFPDEYVLEAQAHSRLQRSPPTVDEASELESYQRRHGQTNTNDDESEENGVEYEYMLLDNQPYLCTIPNVKIEPPAENDTLSKAEEAKELARATDRGWELLSGMSGNCVYFISGWWSYKFCYDEGVRQFHQLPPSRGVPIFPPVEDPGVEGFTLGMYKKSVEGDESVGEMDDERRSDVSVANKKKDGSQAIARSGELVQRGESRYLVQRLEGGTKCDLNGRERRIEVQFHCNPQSADKISLIKETSICAYLMVIQTPRLCSDVAFLPPQKDEPNVVSCAPILGEDQVEDYENDLKTLQAEEKEADVAEAGNILRGGPSSRQTAGDIVIGGHSIVPSDLKLEKSTIVGGGEEKYVDTVASSDGRVLSKEDLEKLGLGDAKAVEKLKKQLEQIAKGQEWKLDVIDTPRGREYRGIIGTEDDRKKEQEKEGKPNPGDDQGEDGEKGSEEEYFKRDEL